jgi:hypothetical protein
MIISNVEPLQGWWMGDVYVLFLRLTKWRSQIFNDFGGPEKGRFKRWVSKCIWVGMEINLRNRTGYVLASSKRRRRPWR